MSFTVTARPLLASVSPLATFLPRVVLSQTVTSPRAVRDHPLRLSAVSYQLRGASSRSKKKRTESSAKKKIRPLPPPTTLPFPPGYTFYPHHNDTPLPYSLMDKVITSTHRIPDLPRCSVFDYLFPPKVKGAQPQWYQAVPPDTLAYIDGLTGRKVTRGEVEVQAKRVATGLKKLGMRRGQVVCVYGMNSLEWVNAAMGCLAGDFLISPANYGYTAPEMAHQLRDSTAQTIFVQPALLPTLHKALELPDMPTFSDDRIILLCQLEDKPKDAERYKSIEEIMGSPLKPKRFMTYEETRTAFLCYSSGTTGLAKGVETSHHNMTSQIQALNIAYTRLSHGTDVSLGILPFGHIYGLTVGLLQPLTVGVPVVILPRFDEIQVLQAIEKYKITWGLVVPPILLALLHSQNVAKFDISSLRGMQSGAAPLGKQLCEAFEKKYPAIKVTQGYGLTETTPVTHVMTVDEGPEHRGKIGRLIPTLQARLVDTESGEDVRQGQPGEMWFRGPSVMKGYWRNHEATKNAFAEGGWFKTGDVAIMDDQGYFSVVDRVKELIKYKGFQVPPAELEALLLTHSKVADAAVIGVYSDKMATELPRAYIVPAQNLGPLAKMSDKRRTAISHEVFEYVKDKAANHKWLRGGVMLVESIPKSPSGKILRKDLRALVKEEAAVQATRSAKL